MSKTRYQRQLWRQIKSKQLLAYQDKSRTKGDVFDLEARRVSAELWADAHGQADEDREGGL